MRDKGGPRGSGERALQPEWVWLRRSQESGAGLDRFPGGGEGGGVGEEAVDVAGMVNVGERDVGWGEAEGEKLTFVAQGVEAGGDEKGAGEDRQVAGE